MACPLYGPKGDVTRLRNWRVKHARRHLQANSVRGLEVDRQTVFDWILHWQSGRLLAFEDSINIARSLSVLID